MIGRDAFEDRSRRGADEWAGRSLQCWIGLNRSRCSLLQQYGMRVDTVALLYVRILNIPERRSYYNLCR